MSVTTSNTAPLNGKTPVSVLADNLIRRALRISNPSDPKEVAKGLGLAYPTEKAELDEEIQGLPIGMPAPAILQGTNVSIAGREIVQAQSNIQRDLDYLSGSSQLKEVQVELESWGETIRTWLADGAAAAPLALDAAARDRVFSARRYLMDYAWVSRLVGAQTPGMSIPYRRFARSLDEAAGLLLVSAGEALSQNNYSGDRLLLQAPASELSARADAASAALRNLSGSVQDAFSPTAWPWGLDSYRKLMERLETAGHGDIRVLLQENGLRAFTDELVDLASNVTGDGLRRLAATHVVALERVDRLIRVGTEFAQESPPMAAFLSALKLFVDTFRGGNAIRLIALGRPLLSSAGLFTFGGLDPGTQTLLNLVQYRAIVAQLNDSLYGMDLRASAAESQFVLDSCLYSIDLAIDLYAVGVNPLGQGIIEQRAAAYGLFIWELLAGQNGLPALLPASGSNQQRFLMPTGQTWPPNPGIPSIYLLLSTLVTAINALGLTGSPRQIYATIANNAVPTQATLGSPSLLAASSQRDSRVMAQELSIIESRHNGLLPLVYALTPGNFDPTLVLGPVHQALQAANGVLGGRSPEGLHVPPPVETTLVHGVRTLAPPGVPAVTGVNPTSGSASGGTIVIITGSGFTGATQVQFGAGNNATDVRVYNDSTISATAPASSGAGQVNVVVTTPTGQSLPAAANAFGYAPLVTGLSPTTGSVAGNTLVNIKGQGFTGVTGVQFGGVPLPAAQISFVSDSLIVVASPPGVVGTVDVQVTTPGGTSAVTQPADQFTYGAAPAITGMAPAGGPAAGGTLVTITGSGLSDATAVRFGRHVATQLQVVSDTEICVLSPGNGGGGNVTVHVVTPSGDLTAGTFSY
jgi:hypothetical protein